MLRRVIFGILDTLLGFGRLLKARREDGEWMCDV